MTTKDVIEQFDKYVISNYGRLPRAIVRGEMGYIWDMEGNRILDMFPGWAVSTIGHCHPKVVEAVRKQVGELIHIDNTFYTPPQGQLAQMLSERSFGGKCFFCNSGAEAVEGALKLARRHTAKSKYRFVTCEGGFHGRTFAAITATAQPKYHEGFGPMLPGFRYVPFNDVDALREAVDEETAAVLFEPIQGEGGVRPASEEFVRAARELTSEQNALLIFDEVQTGCGRTGKWFAYQHYGVEPDMMTLAKTLGGGVAIGAMIAQPDVAESLVPGTHASTFGGNALACAAAIAALEAIEQDNMMQNAEQMGGYVLEKLEGLRDRHPVIEAIRGKGLMIGIGLSEPGARVVDECLSRGLRINCTQETVLRLMPPMCVTREQMDEALAILDGALQEVFESASEAENETNESVE